MGSPLQSSDFFVLEASEALDDLDAALRDGDAPAPDHILRAVRLLRGAALMAGQQPIARAAMMLETVARSHQEQPSSWNAAVHDRLRYAAGEFRVLVTRVHGWNDADTARARDLGRTLELLADPQVGGEPASATPASGAAGDHGRRTLEAGVRAFVAREGALIASALDRAARMLRTSPADRETLYTVIRRMQSLRGLAELDKLTPLPDILDAIELAIGDLTRSFAPPPDAHEVLEAASQALTRLSRDVAESGHPDATSGEARRFAELLIRVFAVERDVVAIEALYADGDAEPCQPSAMAASFQRSGTLGPVEMVSHGEHLGRAADLVAQARSVTERDLQLYQLLGALRSVRPGAADALASALGTFAHAVRATLADGITDAATARLTNELRVAGELLRRAAESNDPEALSQRLLDAAHRLQQDEGAVTETGASGVEDDGDIVPIAQLLLQESEEDDVVPIESLAPEDAPPAPTSASALERTFRTYGRLRRERTNELPSLAAFLRASSPMAPTAPTTPTVALAPDEIPDPVAIGELCYRGRSALARAAIIRDELHAALAHDPALPAVRPLLDELLDLIPLAATES